jgi:hypothetical protein
MLPLGCFPLWGREGVTIAKLLKSDDTFVGKGFLQRKNQIRFCCSS